MSASVLKLDDFPYSKPGYGKKVAVVAVGSAGCKIANELSKQSKLLEHFLYVTCDDIDIANITSGERILVDAIGKGKESPYNVRGLFAPYLSELRHQIRDSQLVFLIAGLGGTVGSGIAPIVAREACSKDAITVAILVMPFSFEKTKHFFAGGALKQIAKHVDGIIIIDNEELLQKDLAIIDAYAEVNQKVSVSLNKLLGSTEDHEYSVGLNNIVNFVRTKSYSVLCLGDSGSEISEHKQAVINAASHFDNTVDKREASKSIVHLCTEKSIAMTDLISSIGGLSGILGNGTMSIEYGLSANSTTTTTAIIVATGFTKTRFDKFDPVDSILEAAGKANLETGIDEAVEVSTLLYQIERE